MSVVCAMCIWRVLCARRNMSTESQAERMETAATEFQRRYHISVDQPAAGPGQVRSGAVRGQGDRCVSMTITSVEEMLL